jgi:hypothetical protein
MTRRGTCLARRGSAWHDATMIRIGLVLASMFVAVGCPGTSTTGAGEGEGEGEPVAAPCPNSDYLDPVITGTLAPADLVELSGLVLSQLDPTRMYGHNDGNSGRTLYVISTTGALMDSIALPFAPVDLEAIGVGACPPALAPSSSCVYLADTGNNFHDRTTWSLFIFAEPSTDLTNNDVVRIDIPLDATRPNAEAMVVERDRPMVTILEKTTAARVRVWQLDASVQEPEMVAVASIDVVGGSNDGGRAVTAADLHPSGQRLALRTYSGVFEYELPTLDALQHLDELTLITVIHQPALNDVRVAYEPQGEALAYIDDGLNLVTASEDPAGLPGQPVHLLTCASPPGS